MDPDENLRQQRHIRLRILAGKHDDMDIARLVELTEALDDWLKCGGALPLHWQRSEKAEWEDYVNLVACNDGQAFEHGKNSAVAIFRAHECFVAKRRHQEEKWATEHGVRLVTELSNRWNNNTEGE